MPDWNDVKPDKTGNRYDPNHIILAQSYTAWHASLISNADRNVAFKGIYHDYKVISRSTSLDICSSSLDISAVIGCSSPLFDHSHPLFPRHIINVASTQRTNGLVNSPSNDLLNPQTVIDHSKSTVRKDQTASPYFWNSTAIKFYCWFHGYSSCKKCSSSNNVSPYFPTKLLDRILLHLRVFLQSVFSKMIMFHFMSNWLPNVEAALLVINLSFSITLLIVGASRCIQLSKATYYLVQHVKTPVNVG